MSLAATSAFVFGLLTILVVGFQRVDQERRRTTNLAHGGLVMLASSLGVALS